MKNLTYAETKALKHTQLLRETLAGLPKAVREYIRAIDQTTTPLTRLSYARDLRLFFNFLIDEVLGFGDVALVDWTDCQFEQIKAADIDAYLDYLSLYINEKDTKYSNSALGKQRKLSSIRSFFLFLHKRGHLSNNVSTLVDMPKRQEKPILRLEIDEVARMLDLAESGAALSEKQKKYHKHTGLRDLAILTLFLGTGIRVSECVGLDIEDIDFSLNGFLVTRKGGNQAILYFPEEVADVLKRYMEFRAEQQTLPGHENALFLSLQNRRMTVRAVEKMVKKYALQAAPLKKRISPHKLRSTFGTNLYRETGDIYLVADVLGHADINTTRRHYAAMDDDRRRMAAQKITLREKKEEYDPKDSGNSG
jgi:integrase/recombinase XerC